MAAAALLVAWAPPAVALDGVTQVCTFADERFTEISGMTYSQRHDGVIYLHNDSSGGPEIYAVDARTCATLATLTIDGIDARDIEAIGSGRTPKGVPVLWVADIGDNIDGWSEVRLHRIREPKVLRDRTVTARTYRFTYPDGSADAEAILADPNSTKVWVVTKKLASGVVYSVPLSRTKVTVAKPVGEVGGLVSDGSVSPDGTRFVLRDYVDAEVRAGMPPGADPQTVYLPAQPQGEAITWTQDGTALLVASERDDRLMQVVVQPAPSAAASPTASATATASSEPSDEATAEAAPADEGGSGNVGSVLLAGVLVVLAGGIIAGVEWRRRRG